MRTLTVATVAWHCSVNRRNSVVEKKEKLMKKNVLAFVHDAASRSELKLLLLSCRFTQLALGSRAAGSGSH